MNKLSQIYSTLFFIGYIKWFPGTIGSFTSLILIIFLYKSLNIFVFIVLFILLSILAIKFIEIYSKSIDKIDPSEIVIDEFLGIYLIIIFSYNFDSFNEFTKILSIFILFRIFDIIKPFPANWVDKNMKNSYGIILDDIIAGIYTIITLSLANALI